MEIGFKSQSGQQLPWVLREADAPTSPEVGPGTEREVPRRTIVDSNRAVRILHSIGFTNLGIKGVTPGIEDGMMAQLLKETVRGTTQTLANTFEKKAS